ncbi:hypothetical protein HGB48_35970 [Actinomadura latina]|uniref:Aminoacyl-tRNA synthetase class I anticodon-binding domain-containing protein n=1 Tax=Actinomadura latina TaxID=163603 RepID=A0A846Z9F6_9ACTN|nr:hypothetical protein [Actinomadura latina]
MQGTSPHIAAFIALPTPWIQAESFAGGIREASQIIRVALTGSTRSPDLHAIAMVIGEQEVLRRAAALLGD